MRGDARVLLIVAIVAMGVMLGASLLRPVTWIQVTTADGTLVTCARVDEDILITLAFTHSMFGGFVHEDYRVGSNGLLERQRMITEHAAAAEYYATDGKIRQTAEGYEVLAPPFLTDRLVIRVDERGQHQLTIGGVTLQLYDQLQASTAVTLEGMRAPLHKIPRECRTGTPAPAAFITTAKRDLWGLGSESSGSVT